MSNLSTLTKTVVVITALLSGCAPVKEDSPQASAPKSVHAGLLQFQPSYQIQHQLVGQIRNQRTSTIGFELSGVVAKVEAQLGDKVQAGQPLAQLDTALLDTEAQQLRASIEQLRAQIDLNQSTLSRQLKLQQQGYQSQQQLDELNSQKSSLQAQLQQAESALAANQLRLQKSQLKAPFSGTISARTLAPGQVVNAGLTVITIVPDLGAEARVGVPVALLNKLGNQLDYHLIHGNQQIPAQLLGQSASVDPVTRTVDLRFGLPESQPWFDGDLIYLDLAETINASNTVVPISALISGLRGRWNLMVPVQDGEHWRLERRDVSILHATNDQAIVSGAIAPGERFVTTGLQALVQGQQVSLTEAKL